MVVLEDHKKGALAMPMRFKKGPISKPKTWTNSIFTTDSDDLFIFKKQPIHVGAGGIVTPKFSDDECVISDFHEQFHDSLGPGDFGKTKMTYKQLMEAKKHLDNYYKGVTTISEARAALGLDMARNDDDYYEKMTQFYKDLGEKEEQIDRRRKRDEIRKAAAPKQEPIERGIRLPEGRTQREVL